MDDLQDTAELLDAITWGRRIVEVRNKDGEKVTYVFRPLTLQEKNMGNYIYKRAKNDAKGLLTREELRQKAIQGNLWKSTYDKDLEVLREELKKEMDERDREVRTKMLDSKGRPKRKQPTPKLRKIDDKIEQIKSTIQKLESDYTMHIELPSAEYNAERERGHYFLHCVTLSFPDMDQVWGSLQDLQNEKDTDVVVNLMRAYYNESIANEAAIRRVARSGFWRCKWIGSKKNRGVKTLFNCEMYDLTLDQFRLVYWSQVYDSAYESLEAPSDEIIEDDKLFDRWMEEQHKKREQERKKSAFEKKLGKKDKTGDANEVGFSVVGEYCTECTCGIKEQAEMLGYEKRGHIHAPSCPYGAFIYYNEDKKRDKVEEVQSANPEQIRRLLAQEHAKIAAAGADGIEEQHLRGDGARSALGMSTKYSGAGDRNKNLKGRARPQ